MSGNIKFFEEHQDSNKLRFPNDDRKFCFNFSHFREVSTLGFGLYPVKQYYHTISGRIMAVKFILIPNNSQINKQENLRRVNVNQAQQEIKLHLKLNEHPNVVNFYGFCIHNMQALLCMEVMDMTLQDLYKQVHKKIKEFFPEMLLGCISKCILIALSDCKQIHNVMHRDVKPTNILINWNGQVKLCDFGLARALEDKTLASTIVGTIAYWPPERFKTVELYDIRADIWSLGITIAEVVYGRLPYNAQDTSDYAMLQKAIRSVTNKEIMSMSNTFNRYTQRFKDFVELCLNDYAHRPKFEVLMKTEFYEYYSKEPTIISELIAELLGRDEDKTRKFAEPTFRNGHYQYQSAVTNDTKKIVEQDILKRKFQVLQSRSARPILITLKKRYSKESYGFSLNTLPSKIHFITNIQQPGLADKHGIEENDYILAINHVSIHARCDNAEAIKIANSQEMEIQLLIMKQVSYNWHVENGLHLNSKYPIRFDINNENTQFNMKEAQRRFNLLTSLSVTWLGESSTFVHLDNINFIVDPLWTNNLIYERYTDPVVSIDEIPPLDFGLITNIYNFDVESVAYLTKKNPKMEWFVPLGCKKWLYRCISEEKIHELSWGIPMPLTMYPKLFQIWCVPAKVEIPMKELCCGWVVIGPSNKFYHSGSTAFWEYEFRTIGLKLGPFDLAAISIGHFTPTSSLSPLEAIETHQLVRSSKTIGILHGTYKWDPENDKQTKNLLEECTKMDEMLQNSFIILNEGESQAVSYETRNISPLEAPMTTLLPSPPPPTENLISNLTIADASIPHDP